MAGGYWSKLCQLTAANTDKELAIFKLVLPTLGHIDIMRGEKLLKWFCASLSSPLSVKFRQLSLCRVKLNIRIWGENETWIKPQTGLRIPWKVLTCWSTVPADVCNAGSWVSQPLCQCQSHAMLCTTQAEGCRARMAGWHRGKCVIKAVMGSPLPRHLQVDQ